MRPIPAVLAVVTTGVLLVSGLTSDDGGVLTAGALQPHSAVAFGSALPSTPAYAGDAGDPDVVESAGTYYAFTTGTALGNHLQALVDTSGSPQSGWRSYTGLCYGSTALPTVRRGRRRTPRPHRASSSSTATG